MRVYGMCTCECLHGAMCTAHTAAQTHVCVQLYAIRCLSSAACAGVDLRVLYVRCACLPMRTQLHMCMCACVLAHGNIDGV